MGLGEETTEVEKVSLEPQEDPYENKITLFEATEMLLDEGNIDKTFICEGTVVKVMEGKGWYYFACKTCHQKTGNENGRPTCNNCADDFEGEIPWYRVSLKIRDKTESAVVTIIGRTLERMLKMTVDEHIKLKERCEKLGEPEKTMRVFDRIINKTFLFKLLMTEYNITNQSDNFKCIKVFPPKSSGTPIPKAGEKRRVLTKPTGPKTPLKKNKNNVVISDDEEPAEETDKVLEEKMIEDKNGEKQAEEDGEKQAEEEDEEQDN
ncbi:hypothetical protein MKW94_015594 [Papaver nudicaule]|uniref:Replication factor A C-terminal domain-containing protein n=1 Tax=Papaver nudicaule TaxID=74823 RepID=A0AA41V0I8_PAPNU|nr:hypothetical protein [Papaver nudicaule]